MKWSLLRSKKVAASAIGLLALSLLISSFMPAEAAAPTTRKYRGIPSTVNVTAINVTGTGQLQLIPAQTSPNQIIVVLGGELFLSAATTIQFQSASNNLTGPQSMLAWAKDAPFRENGDSLAWKETNAGEAFNATVGTSCTIAGELIWYATVQ